MTLHRKIQWLFLALTAALMMFLKWLHLGVTNYNLFLIILIGWILVMVVAFRALTPEQRKDS